MESISVNDECIFVKIENRDIRIVVGLVYLSPNSDINKLLNDFNERIFDIHLQ